MDYRYENLGDERFQEFCNCLVAKEFPNVQAFPVGQPDGGRDAVAYQVSGSQKNFVVFQVKYVRDPSLIKDVHKWLTTIISDEINKINKLIPKGATGYYLLTNVKGTGHLDAGTIDKVNKILEENIRIPAICWWRDDLNMLVEKDPIFKWSFPEILNGQDILNAALFSGIQEHKERRESVVKAYLADQYKLDDEVKFKQINLKNKLFNLFIDIPVRIKNTAEENGEYKKIMNVLLETRTFPHDKDGFSKQAEEEDERLTAASLLLHPKVQLEIESVLLEGGPGQGKSTIVQYISQVHRVRLLNKAQDLALLPLKFKYAPVRLPFKIDLRHIAAWVEGKNPYLGSLNDDFFSRTWNNSLESFLIGHIFYHSKVDGFGIADLIAIYRISSILFVFDGFDEIANADVRKSVIDFIDEGLARIAENAKSIQVIITSRPSIFSNAINFSINKYAHFELTDLTPATTKRYVRKWVKANDLNDVEAEELKRLVDEKIELPHLRELAKSPMQLAIFINLLRTKGESLPNKRTALYESYVDLVFDRESEKSKIVRDHRDLIIDMHRYIAWVLHSEAELLKTGGSIRIDDLKTRLKEYLIREGHRTNIADELFDVVKDRVCALVSRVQGTYEFEVQPLREFFCAKYLYETAPHSSAGNPKTGTRTDIFKVISRNFYWRNVTRFFAGCFSKGELADLIQNLEELQEEEPLGLTGYPIVLTSQLLSDYVFTQYPRLLNEAVNIIVDALSRGGITNQDPEKSQNEPIVLPIECGGYAIVQECFRQLKQFPAGDYADELITVIKNNPFHTVALWKESVSDFKGSQLTTWLEYAAILGLLRGMTPENLIQLIKEGTLAERIKRIRFIVYDDNIKAINTDPELKCQMYDSILHAQLDIPTGWINSENSFTVFGCIMKPFIYKGFLEEEEPGYTELDQIMELLLGKWGDHSTTHFSVNDEIDEKIERFLHAIKGLGVIDFKEWQSSASPWELIIENGRTIFGNSWAFCVLANIAAARDGEIDPEDNELSLCDNAASLVKRVSNARLRSGDLHFWNEQLCDCSDPLFVMLVLFTWVSVEVLQELAPAISKLLEELSNVEFCKLESGFQDSLFPAVLTVVDDQLEEKVVNQKFGERWRYMMSIRLGRHALKQYVRNSPNEVLIQFNNELEWKLHYSMDDFFSNPLQRSLLEEIKAVYATVASMETMYNDYRFFHSTGLIKFPYEIAREIILDRKKYPRILVSTAERECMELANGRLIPVGQAAKNEKWFNQKG